MTKRLFIGFKIRPSKKLLDAYDDIKTFLAFEKIKWVKIENLHFTLKFLGDTEIQCIDNITDILHSVANDFEPTEIEMKNFGVFPNMIRPRVLWFGMYNYDIISELAAEIENHLEKIGLDRSDKPFKPHLTIGRVKFMNNRKILHEIYDKYKDFTFQKMQVSEFDLIESILKPEGPTYIPLQSFKLGSYTKPPSSVLK